MRLIESYKRLSPIHFKQYDKNLKKHVQVTPFYGIYILLVVLAVIVVYCDPGYSLLPHVTSAIRDSRWFPNSAVFLPLFELGDSGSLPRPYQTQRVRYPGHIETKGDDTAAALPLSDDGADPSEPGHRPSTHRIKPDTSVSPAHKGHSLQLVAAVVEPVSRF